MLSAVVKLRDGKAGDGSALLPVVEKTASSEDEFVSTLLELVQNVWRECQVSSVQCDVILIPIPKNGDLSKCDKWRGISLLDVVKVVASILQERLQKLAEE